MSSTQKKQIVYAIYPNANGFGYVYMENARKLIDFGSVRINPISNLKIMNRIKMSFDYMRPSLVIVKDADGKSSRTGRRVRKLIDLIETYTCELKLPVVKYSRDQIRDVFSQFGATTKYDISQTILAEFKELEMKLPKKRKLWTSEDYNMAIFDAMSLALTWFYLND
jgi:hypothetical protein